MSRFIEHTSCPKCGSSDGRALYEGGSSFCFVCKSYSRGTNSPYLTTEQKDNDDTTRQRLRSVVATSTTELSEPAIKWLSTYEIGIPEALGRGILWNQQRSFLLFVWYGDQREPILAQARNFNPPTEGFKQTKYITYGTADDVTPIYYRYHPGNRTDTLVLVEDAVSAIKVARQSDSIPCLTSNLSLDKIKRLVRLYGRFKVWLDSDMFHHAQQIAQRLQLCGAAAHAVWTELDPKCYTNEEITGVLT